MKKSHAVLLGISLLLAFTSCKSAPKAEEPVNEQPAAEEKPAEEAKPAEQPAETRKPADNDAALKAAETARQAALDAGADKTAADQFAAADALYNGLKDKIGKGEDAVAGLKDVTARYNALEEYTKALAVKARIDELDYASYDSSDYDKGNKAVDSLKTLFGDQNATGGQMYDQAHTAFTSYTKALATAFRKLAQDERAAAFVAKRNADSVYAGVSQKDTYNGGVKSFRDGDSSYAMQDAENALKHYQDAHQVFDALYKDISEKRAAAQKAIDDAKAKVAASADYATQADKSAPLEGDNIKGIEAHDAVLLEKQTFEDPKQAETDVPETIDGAAASSTTEAAK